MGQETLTTWETRRKGDLILHVISPIHSVKDRLAPAIHFKDLNSARQAAQIAKLHKVDFAAITCWCETEGGAKAFSIFETFMREQIQRNRVGV